MLRRSDVVKTSWYFTTLALLNLLLMQRGGAAVFVCIWNRTNVMAHKFQTNDIRSHVTHDKYAVILNMSASFN